MQLLGSALARGLLRAAGWRVVFDGLPAAQGVAIVYPHTSNWDFVVGILAKWAIGIPVTFWGKDSLFRVPVFGRNIVSTSHPYAAQAGLRMLWKGGNAVDAAIAATKATTNDAGRDPGGAGGGRKSALAHSVRRVFAHSSSTVCVH